MPRAKTILQCEFPYNITARCINREWFNVPMPTVWKYFCEELARTNKDHELCIHSFVLMNNHFHLIASTPRANISLCMHQFMYRVSKKLTKAGNRINGTFAGRHYKTILQEQNYYLNAYKYNYRNPIEASICNRVEDYEYSTLHSLLGKSEVRIPIVEDTTFLSDRLGTLKWLNTAPDKLKLEAVRFALKRQYFTSKKVINFNKVIMGPGDLL
jgi:putative transposase